MRVLMAVNCQQRRRRDIANKQTLENRLRQNHNHQPPPEREIKSLYEGEKNGVMSVLCGDVGCWALGSCGAVRLCSQRRVSIYLLHVYKQWEEDICCSSSTTLHSIHFSPYSYPFPLLGETTLHLRIDSWFYQVETPFGGSVGCCFRPDCSILE